MLYINSKDEPEFVNENDESLESHNSIYDLSESLDYTGLNYIRVFPEGNRSTSRYRYKRRNPKSTSFNINTRNKITRRRRWQYNSI